LAIEKFIPQCSQTVATNVDAMQWPHVDGKKLGHIAPKGLLASRGPVCLAATLGTKFGAVWQSQAASGLPIDTVFGMYD